MDLSGNTEEALLQMQNQYRELANVCADARKAISDIRNLKAEIKSLRDEKKEIEKRLRNE